MEFPVSASLGPVGPLLQQLDLSARNSNPGDIQELKHELQVLYDSLKNLYKAEDVSSTAGWWMKEVRDLCHEIKDYCDLRPLSKWDFRGFIASVRALRQRDKDLQLTTKSSQQVNTPDVTLHLPLPAADKEDLVELLAFGDERAKQLRVVTMYGYAGAVNTEHARDLYDMYGGRFQCRAFVRVSRDPDRRSLLTSILSQIKAPSANHRFADVDDLISSIKNHLEHKRFFIVIDDLWTIAEWNFIMEAFPGGYCHSRIITTTQIKDVALASRGKYLHIFEMTPLSDDEIGGNPSPEEMKQELNHIYSKLTPELKTCLLYLNMYQPSHMVRKDDLVKQWIAERFQPMENWDEKKVKEKLDYVKNVAGANFDELVRRDLIQVVERNFIGEVMSYTVQQIVLDMIAKKCEEVDFITTVNLMEKGGLPHKARRLSIQFRDEVNAKIPQNIVLTIVRSLTFCGFHGCVPSLTDCKLLQVLILYIWGDNDEAIFDLSRISELLLLRYVKIACNVTVKLPDKICGLKDLETLEVDARAAVVPSDVTSRAGLLHLSLPSASLPRDVSALESLYTLGCYDLSRNSDQEVKKLFHLKSLEDLHMTCSAAVHQADMQEKMDVIWRSILLPHSSLKSIDLVPTGANHLNTAFLNIEDTRASVGPSTAEASTSASVSSSPSVLERLELSPRICIFSSIPERFAILGQLRILKIAVRDLSKEGVEVLQRLPALAALSIYVWTTFVADKVEPTFLIGKEKMPLASGLLEQNGPPRIEFCKGGFQVLSYFKFTCPAPCLVFQEKAMPSVRRIKLSFNASRIRTYNLQDAGLENLTGLEEISLKIGKDGGFQFDRREAKSALKHVFALHSPFQTPPVINLQSVDHIFGADKSERAQSSYMSPESTSHPKHPGEEISCKRMDDVHHEEAMRILIYIVGHKNYKFIQQEMELMTMIIEQNKGPNQGSFQEKWVLKLQELVYDIDDFRYNLSLLSIRSLFSTEMLIINMLDRMKHLKGRINTLRNWRELASQWNQIGDSSAAATSTPLGYQTAPYYRDLVGIDGPIRELLELMPDHDLELTVISIVGCRGLGKSTLAREVYHQLVASDGPGQRPSYSNSDHFRHFAFVDASDCNSSEDILNKIHQQPFREEERYLLVIDQVQRAEVWDGVLVAFRNYNTGSRIIMTTSIRSIPEAFTTTRRSAKSYIYTMRGLGDADSKTLFWKKFYGYDTEPAPVLADVSKGVLQICDGLPLSLLSVARYLGQQHRTGRIEKFGGYIGGAPEALGEMNSALAQCYNSLPDNVHRTCLLSMSIFPQGHQISRKSVIRRWIAEGLVAGHGARNAECVAADLFDELIDRNIVKPVLVGNNSRVKRCRPHGLMLNFIVNKAISMNFVTLIRKDESFPNIQDPLVRRLSVQEEPLVRRLSVQEGTIESGSVASEIGLSVVRSLTIFKGVVFDLQSCKLLRILDLEGCTGIGNAVLDAVCQLMILKYLSLRGSDVRRIPKRIRKLQYLETMDLRETEVEELPIEVIMLPWLAHLFGKFYLPRELQEGKKNSKLHKFLSEKSRLQTLSGFVMGQNSGYGALILDARYLRKVKIWCSRYPAVPSENILVSSLNRRFNGSSALESLSIDLDTYASPGFLHSLEEACMLKSMKLRGQLGKLPNFITSCATTLRELELSSTGLSSHELSSLQELPFLLYLKLYEEDRWEFGSGKFIVESDGFPSLERLCFQAPTIPDLVLKKGAKTKLASLYLLCPEYPPSRIDGIDYLQHLNEVVLHGSLEASQLEDWKETTMKHENRPRVTKQSACS